MNTSKQINVMIGFLFLSFIVYSLYILTEPQRQASAREEQELTSARRGAELFVNNCRNCHGMVGEGHIGPPVAEQGYLVLGEGNRFGAPPTPQGEADQIRAYLFNTIACGRSGTFMPLWSERYGGSMSETQINYIVTLMTTGRWELVEEIGHHHDEEAEMGPEDILVQPEAVAGLAPTQNNCGQYSSAFAAEIRGRDPFAAPGTPTTPATPTPAPGETPAPDGLEVEMGEFFVTAPESVDAGEVTFNLKNSGAVVHNLRVIRSDLPEDGLPQAGGMVDEGQVDVVARSADIQGGQSVGVRATLEPGSYVLICNVPAHYQLGMHASMTVR